MSNAQNVKVGGVETPLPEGIEIVSLADQTFLVPYDLSFVHRPEVKDDGRIDFSGITSFFNPRRMTGQGFDPSSMHELYEDVKEDGLIRTFLGRWVLRNGVLVVEVLDGERRHITVGKMRDKNDLVYCRRRSEVLPALEVYSKVLMVVRDLDDAAAHRLAYSVSERQVPWGEGNNARLIRQWRECGVDDAEILKRTHKTTQWLMEQDRINTLDEKTFSYLCEEKINRSFALKMVKIENVEERHRYLDASYADAVARHAQVKKKKTQDLRRAEDAVEVADANVACAEEGFGSLEKAKADLAEAQQTVEAKKQELAKIEPPQAKTANLRRGVKKVKEGSEDDEGGGVATLTATAEALDLGLPLKVGSIRSGKEQVEKVIQAKGRIGDTRVVVPVSYMLGAKAALEAVLAGEEDVVARVKRAFQAQHFMKIRSDKPTCEAEEDAERDIVASSLEDEDEEDDDSFSNDRDEEDNDCDDEE